jgi:hypothetical protein
VNLTVLCKTPTGYIYLYLDINVSGITYTSRKSKELDEMPQFIIGASQLYELDEHMHSTARLLRHIGHYFTTEYREARVHSDVFIRPVKLVREGDVITGGDYRIFPTREGVAVNYAPGKKREFTTYYNAIDWVLNQHQPAQSKKKLLENVLCIF